MRYANQEMEESIKHRQKMLIPVNIVLCVLCLVAILTMYFLPIIKIDIGRILANEQVQEYVLDTVSSSVSAGTSEKSGNTVLSASVYDDSSSSSATSSIDVAAIAKPVVKSVLNTIAQEDVSISVTPQMASKCVFNGSDDKSEPVKKIVNQILTGSEDGKGTSGLIGNLETGIKNVFTGEEAKKELQTSVLEGLVRACISMGKQELEENKADIDTATYNEITNTLDNISDNDIKEVVDILGRLDDEQMQNVSTGEEYLKKEILKDALDKLLEILENGVGASSETYKEAKESFEKSYEDIEDAIVDLYTDTMDRIDGQKDSDGNAVQFSLEVFVCVQLSQYINISEFSQTIQDMLNSTSSSSSTNTSKVYSSAPYKASVFEDTTSSSETENTLYYSYGDILNGLTTNEEGQSLTEQISAAVTAQINEGATELVETVTTVLTYMFYVCSAFMALWAIQFLFSFIHIFTPNKCVSMWYTKLLCWIPAIIWVLLTALSMTAVAEQIVSMVGDSITVGLLTGVMSGITSFTWICGACWLAMWLVSIFWAFPVKHKLRKLKKENKRMLREGAIGAAAAY